MISMNHYTLLRKGVTLIELLMVLIIVGIISSFSVTGFKAQQTAARFKTEFSLLQEVIMRARMQAVMEGVEMTVAIGMAGETLDAVTSRARSLQKNSFVGQDLNFVIVYNRSTGAVSRVEPLRALRAWSKLGWVTFDQKGVRNSALNTFGAESDYRVALCPFSGCSLVRTLDRLDNHMTEPFVLNLIPAGSTECITGLCSRIEVAMLSISSCNANYTATNQFFCF